MKHLMTVLTAMLGSTPFAHGAEVVASCNDFQIVADGKVNKIVWPTDEKNPISLTYLGEGAGDSGPTKSFYARAGHRIIFVNFTTSSKSSLIETFSLSAGQTIATSVEACSQ